MAVIKFIMIEVDIIETLQTHWVTSSRPTCKWRRRGREVVKTNIWQFLIQTAILIVFTIFLKHWSKGATLDQRNLLDTCDIFTSILAKQFDSVKDQHMDKRRKKETKLAKHYSTKFYQEKTNKSTKLYIPQYWQIVHVQRCEEPS